MKLRIAAWIVAALMLAATYPAWSQGFGGMGRHFGRMGANGATKKTVAAATCNGTGLIFNVACNSQYIGTL